MIKREKLINKPICVNCMSDFDEVHLGCDICNGFRFLNESYDNI